MSNEHTPGPWEVYPSGMGIYSLPVSPIDGDRYFVAYVTTKPEADENAHVMAAAPDLLEAWELRLSTEDDGLSPDEIADRLKRADELGRAAVHKARATFRSFFFTNRLNREG